MPFNSGSYDLINGEKLDSAMWIILCKNKVNLMV